MKNFIVKSAVAVFALAASVGAFAADGGAASQAKVAFDQLTSQATEFTTYAWGLAVLIVGSTVGIKLFKKFVNKAS
ncbi:major coat protein [Xenorhabdus sp. TS4]|uniref:major coat protein n=1 Tax=Xenorhabdus sp. TS4 TaxID=1873483 RepID=UPI001656BF0C|nr:hypothetical protein [Xenorhabdus sp. TS4]MBC8950730.1 hypothetical protein [Xenorhabdus sp. TS4]